MYRVPPKAKLPNPEDRFADQPFTEPVCTEPVAIAAQASLFSVAELRTIRYNVQERVAPLAMDGETLQAWKQRVFQFQRQVETTPAAAQGSLFDLLLDAGSETGRAAIAGDASGESWGEFTDPETIQPFTLPQQNTEFWRWKASDMGVSALYFVIDYTLPLLLYVGETVKSNQRWKGEHDCKRYLLNYRQVHYQNELPSQLGIAFWANAPVPTRQRQKLESALIQKWRSPFNKENWEFWQTPFVGSK